MDIKNIKILGGNGKDGQSESVTEVDLEMGDVLSIIGPTGSGKTALISDIELYANRNTPTNRRVLLNGVSGPEEFMDDPSRNPIARITQHTNFLSDLPVKSFLETHAKIRQNHTSNNIVGATLDFANQLTGEAIIHDSALTELSGGQTRALLIADAVVIGNSSILLLDEIENAGIDRARALELLKSYRKIFIFVTHDPRIALLSDFRIVMEKGAMMKKIFTSSEEKDVAEEIREVDSMMLSIRNRLSRGEQLQMKDLECKAELNNS